MIGLQHYINDANTRFTNQLFTDNKRKISGLARIGIRDVPYVKDGNDYKDALFDDNYHISLFYLESGDRKFISGGSECSVDLIVCADMRNFTEYEEEEIIDVVYQIFKKTHFRIEGINRDMSALSGFEYPDKLKETMYPFFVFRIKTKITIILNQN